MSTAIKTKFAASKTKSHCQFWLKLFSRADPSWAPMIFPTLTEVQKAPTAKPRLFGANQFATMWTKAGKQIDWTKPRTTNQTKSQASECSPPRKPVKAISANRMAYTT